MWGLPDPLEGSALLDTCFRTVQSEARTSESAIFIPGSFIRFLPYEEVSTISIASPFQILSKEPELNRVAPNGANRCADKVILRRLPTGSRHCGRHPPLHAESSETQSSLCHGCRRLFQPLSQKISAKRSLALSLRLSKTACITVEQRRRRVRSASISGNARVISSGRTQGAEFNSRAVIGDSRSVCGEAQQSSPGRRLTPIVKTGTEVRLV